MRPTPQFERCWREIDYDDKGWDEQEWPVFRPEHPGFAEYKGKWVLRKFFPFEPVRGHIYRIRLGGVFCTYRVFLNGHELGGGKGYFIPHEYDVTALLKSENIFVVETDHEPGEGAAPGPGGIWSPVEIIETGRHFIMSSRVETRSANETNATLTSTIRVWSPGDLPIRLAVTIREAGKDVECARIEKTYFLVAGENDLLDRWNLSPYRPWCTYDQGKPGLYEADVNVSDEDGVLCDGQTIRFGIRTVEVNRRALILNGRELPVRVMVARPSRAPLEEPEMETLERARAAGANLCRVQGHVKPPEFYRAADDAGILIWQDVLLPDAGIGYSDESAKAAEQALDIACELGGYPSVALWFAGQKTKRNLGEGIVRRMFSGVACSLESLRMTRLIRRVLSEGGEDRPVVNSMKAINAVPVLGRE